MTLKPVKLEPEANDELYAAVEWYEGQRTGLGAELWSAVRAALDEVQRDPSSFARLSGLPDELPARAAFVRKFPYKVVFLDLPVVVRVLAIAHVRRAPDYWSDRA